MGFFNNKRSPHKKSDSGPYELIAKIKIDAGSFSVDDEKKRFSEGEIMSGDSVSLDKIATLSSKELELLFCPDSEEETSEEDLEAERRERDELNRILFDNNI